MPRAATAIAPTRPSAARAKRAARQAAEAAHQARIFGALERVRADCDAEARRNADPVEFVHRYRARADQELVALLASSLAFGNVKALRAKIDDALARIGPSVASAADDPRALRKRLAGWRHRVYVADDAAMLLVGGRRVQRAHGSLGAALASELQRTGDLRSALSAWTGAIRVAGGLDRAALGGRRGPGHILADPGAGSAAKRVLLMVRWMARPADGVDLGLWDVPLSRLLVPVDVHIHRLGYNLGFTARKSADWKAAEEITAALARFDAADPVKYDFALCHLGMLQRCPSRRDAVRCEGCGIQSVCRFWR